MSDPVTLARGDASRIVEPRRLIARTDDEWRQLWALHAGPETAPPPVDFDARIVAAAFAGERPTAGYAVEIAAASGPPDGTRLLVTERAPAPGTLTAQVLTSPFHIVTLPRPVGDVTWSGSGARTGESGTRTTDPAYRIPETVSSTGLTPRTAAVLAYLAGPLSGAVMLVAESANDDVRFHAWQSVIALGALAIAVGLGYLLALASLFVSATALSFIVRVSTVLWIVLLVVWAICLWKAYTTRRWKLPLAGNWAERLTARH